VFAAPTGAVTDQIKVFSLSPSISILEQIKKICQEEKSEGAERLLFYWAEE
jgi:hypothetical protein